MDKNEVAQFLDEFRLKKKIWNILFFNERNKNAQALATLEISPAYREKVIDELSILDYILWCRVFPPDTVLIVSA